MDLVNNSLMFRSKAQAFKVCASSGTVGRPKLLFRTEEDFEKSVNNQIRLMKWSGVKSGDIVAIVQPFGLWGYGELTQEACRRLGVLAIPVGMASNEIALELVRTLEATALDISPSRLRDLLFLSQQVGNQGTKIRIVMTAGEPLTKSLIEQVERAWGRSCLINTGAKKQMDLAEVRLLEVRSNS